MQIPLVENTIYNYYQLFAFPVVKNSQYQVIIPHTKHLILNKDNYGSTNKDCQEVSKEHFLCDGITIHPIDESSPCEVQLLSFSQNYHNCQPTKIDFQSIKLQKIAEDKWIAVLQNKTKVSVQCKNNEFNSEMKGSNVITLPIDCSMKIYNNIITTFEKSKYHANISNIPNLKISIPGKHNKVQLSPMNIQHADLEDLHPILQRMEENRKALDNVQSPIINTTEISAWTILLYIIGFVTAAFILWRYYKSRRRPAADQQTSEKIDPIVDSIQLQGMRNLRR